MDQHDKVLHDYMAQVIKIQRARHRQRFTRAELDQIARESGMSQEDLQYVHEKFDGLVAQGHAFARHGNWEDSVGAFEQAAMLAPSDPDVLAALGRAYWMRGNAAGSEDDRRNARLFAEQALEVDPDHDRAIELLSEMRTPARASGSPARPVARGSRSIAILAMAAAAVVGAGILVFMAADTEPVAPEQVAQEPAAEAGAEAPAPAEQEAPEPQPLLTPMRSFGGKGVGPGMFDDARHVAVDGDGNIYVGEYASARIQRFDPAGTFGTTWTLENAGYLSAIAADDGQRVFAIANGRIEIFDGSTGRLLGTVDHAPGFNDLVPTPDGGLIASWNEHYRGGMFMDVRADDSRDKLVRFDADGRRIATVDRALSRASRSFVLDTKLATDGRDNIYAATRRGAWIYRFTLDGEFIDRFSLAHDARSARVDDIIVDRWGRLYVLSGRDLHLFSPDGEHLRRTELPGGASAIAFGSDAQLVALYRDHVEIYDATSLQKVAAAP